MFKRYGKNHFLFFGIALIFIFCFTAVYGIYGKGRPMYKPRDVARRTAEIVKPVIKTDTVILEEIRYLCGDRVSTRIPTTSDLVGLDFASLAKKYPPDVGWSINDTVKNTLVLARVEKQVCPYHRDFRHLGISDGFLAVYEGPLGFNQKILTREDINVNSLPAETQTDLAMAMNYNNQTSDIQGRLKAAYEFETEAQLNSALENFDEFKE